MTKDQQLALACFLIGVGLVKHLASGKPLRDLFIAGPLINGVCAVALLGLAAYGVATNDPLRTAAGLTGAVVSIVLAVIGWRSSAQRDAASAPVRGADGSRPDGNGSDGSLD